MSTPERLNGARALLRFLARQGRVLADDVSRLEAMLAEGSSVHEILEREGIISQKDLALLLAETLRLKIVDLTTYPLDANVTRELKEAVATRYEVVPISIDARTIEVVTANPLDLDGLKAVEFATGKRVQPVVATQVEVKDALAHTYRLQESLEQFLQLVPAGESLVVNELSDEGEDLRTIAADAELPPVIKLADKMLIEGIKSRASDIHVEPEGDSVLVRYRVDGILEEAFRFPKWIQNPLVARLKVMAKLDITERRRPQDGRIQVRYLDKTVDMRVSSLPAQHGEKITLRILDASQAVKALDRLGFSAGDLKILRDAAKKPQGMILITGPTGSGKTTTLYALLREIFSPKTNIVTIENPIEYQLKGINQVEVNEKQGLTFSDVLRSVLRQDPDVILLGEIRDKETAHIAFQAASTGHLVLSTVHTNDAAGAVTRLLDLGLEPYAIASALHLVVAQRLVRQLCQHCAKPIDLDDETRRQMHLAPGDVAHQPVGCAQCRHQGYRSRLGVYEMLPMTAAITKLVEAGAGESMVRQQARSEGVHSMLDDSVWKVRTGTTSIEEVQRVVQISDAVGVQCPGCQKDIAEDYAVCPHCSKVLRASCGGCAKPLNAEWVRCPYCGETAVADEAPAAAVGAAPAARRSFKALVVDDTATIRDVVRHTLEHSDLGLTVVTAEDGPQALDIAGREHPDIVILDISMPGMDGFEVCRRLRSEMRTAFVPVLMLTAHDSEDDVAKGFGVGADDYMVKPFRREGLIARVRRILERTYGSQAVGGPPLPDTTSGASFESMAAAAGTVAQALDGEVAATVAELSADRDALRSAVQASEARLTESDARQAATDARIAAGDARGAAVDARLDALVSRIDDVAGALGAVAERTRSLEARPAALPDASPALDEVRTLLERVRESQERGFAELRADTARALTTAEQALARAQEAVGAVPSVDFGAMMSTFGQLQAEQAVLRSALQAASNGSDGVDEECERRVRQIATEVTELRTAMTTVETALQGEALATIELMARDLATLQRELAEQTAGRTEDVERTAAAEAAASAVRAEMESATRRLHDEIAKLQQGVAGQDGTDAVLTARVAALAEQIDALAERMAMVGPRVDASADALAAMRDDVDARLVATRDEIGVTLSTTRDEVGAALAAMRDETEALVAARAAALAERTEAVAERLDAIVPRVDAFAAETHAALAAVRGETHAALAAVRDDASVARHEAARLDGDVRALREEVQADRRELTGLTDEVRQGAHAIDALSGKVAADAERAASEREDLRRLVMTREDVERRVEELRADFERRMEATEAASRALAEGAQRDAVAAASAAAQSSESEALAAVERTATGLVDLRNAMHAELGTHRQQLVLLQDRVGQARRAAVKLVRRVRASGRAVEARVEAREAECDRRLAEVREQALAAVDRLRFEYAAAADRLASQDTSDATRDAEEQRLGTELQELKAVVARVDGDHRRHAADVEERLRNVMRTAAGGFDVQIALLRGKVEVLARTLREQVPLDPSAPTQDALFQHRHGLMATLQQQLAALQKGTDWRPQRVLDLLVETSLAAAISPLKRILQMAQGEWFERSTTEKRTGSDPTDESASPS